MKLYCLNLRASSVLLLLSIVVTLSARCELGSPCGDDNLNSMSTMPGGVREVEGFQNNMEIDELGRFAVEEHNKKENKVLEYNRVLKAKEQVVAGTLYDLTLEVVEAGKKMIYEAKIWVKPWMHFKELQEFKLIGDSASFTSSDLVATQGDYSNKVLEYSRVVKAEGQVVAGTLYDLTLEAKEYLLREKKKIYEPWMKFKEVGDSVSSTSS